jgi:hypothetical protein
MSHLIIKPYDAVFTPETSQFSETWHGLQTRVKGGIALDGSNIEQVLRPVMSCGLKPDFDSPIANIPAELAAEMGEQSFAEWKLILADCRQDGNGVFPLHVAKKGYAIHQNKDLFDSMVKSAIEVLGADNFEIATVGTLGAYSQFFVSIAIKGASEGFEVGKGDVWKTFFNLVSSHNSLVASQTLLSLVRIVCMNTVNASIADGEESGTNAKIKHSKNSLELVTPQTFAANLKGWINAKATMQATLARIKVNAMTIETFRAFAAGIFTNKASDDLSTNSYNRIADMETLFSKGRGNIGATQYDALNAFTEYFTSGNGIGNPKLVQAEKRIASANFGQGNGWKLQAMATLANEETFASVIQRGAILFEDKHKERMETVSAN